MWNGMLIYWMGICLLLILAGIFLALLILASVQFYKKENIFLKRIETDRLWIKNLVNNNHPEEFFKANHFQRIGFWGFNDQAYLLFKEIKKSKCLQTVFCVSDLYRQGMSPIPGLEILSEDDFRFRIADADIMIVFGSADDEADKMRIRDISDGKLKAVSIYDLEYYIGEIAEKG